MELWIISVGVGCHDRGDTVQGIVMERRDAADLILHAGRIAGVVMGQHGDDSFIVGADRIGD